MRRFGLAGLGIAEGGTVLFSAFEDGGEMWTGSGPRLATQDICFDERFLDAPSVHVSLSMWDISGGANQRADIQAVRITREGFSIEFRTWGDTRVARVRASWMAIGPIAFDDDFSPD